MLSRSRSRALHSCAGHSRQAGSEMRWGSRRLVAGAELLVGRGLLLGAPLLQRLLRLLLGALLGLRRTFHAAQPTATGGRALGLRRGPVERDRCAAPLQRVVAAAAAGERHLETERLTRMLVEPA